jgi:hypothetical protein
LHPLGPLDEFRRDLDASRPLVTAFPGRCHLLRLLPFLFGGHRQLAIENLALRHQLSVYERTMTRRKLRRTDRLLWVGLARAWAGWRRSLVIVTPDTVLRWQRRRFREHWATLSGRPTVGRPPVHADISALVRTMAAANPLWGAPRIHGRVEGWRGTSSGPSPAPATSNGANGFPVRRFPADFASRVMRPIV